MPQKIIWTIGHSTRQLDDFIQILKEFKIECLADIRGLPGSRRYPHFNKEVLEKVLPENNIRYIHYPGLGGRRKVKKDSKNTGWRLDAFRGYADYMETEEFSKAINELEEVALREQTVYMCAESVWWRCHRSMVSDYMKLNGWKVMHIMSAGKSTEHSYTQPARIVNGKINYEA